MVFGHLTPKAANRKSEAFLCPLACLVAFNSQHLEASETDFLDPLAEGESYQQNW